MATHTLLSDNSFASSRTSVTTESISPAANKLITLMIATRSNTSDPDPVVPSVSGCGLTWEAVVSEMNAAKIRVSIFRALGASPTAGALTINFTTNVVAGAWEILQWSGTNVSGTNGSGAIAQSAGAHIDVADNSLSIPLSPAVSEADTLYAAVYANRLIDISPDSGWTEVAEIDITSKSNTVATQEHVGSDVSATFGFSASTTGAAVAIEVKDSSAFDSITDLTVVRNSDNGDTEADLSWTAVSGATTNAVHMSTSSNFTPSVDTLVATLGNVSSYTVQDLVGSTRYYFRVLPGNGTETGNSNLVNLVTAPPRPSDLEAIGVSTDQVNLTYTRNSSLEFGFNIYALEAGNTNYTRIATIDPGSSSFLVEGLKDDDTDYSFYVTAFDNTGESGPSNVATATTLAEFQAPLIVFSNIVSAMIPAPTLPGSVVTDSVTAITTIE